ncbi:MAG: Flp pilus assembly protein CpaB [Candidatus Omnitrophica bacterium]|nr:Flp pilus assembly protein CpaB [Candidatus Omnitrophota bacterium]
MSRKIAIIIAIILGVLAVFLTNVYFQQREAKIAGQRGEEMQVVIAATEITKGTLISHGMLAYSMVPVRYVQPGALKIRDQAVNKVALSTIMRGEQILTSKLSSPDVRQTLAMMTPPGKRAVTISLDASSTVGGMIRPGDYVDILASFTNPSVILTLFQDILVLAMGQDMVAASGEEGRSRTRTTTSRREAVTLALSPQEVQILSVAMEYGKIRLTLRPRMEAGKALPSVDLSQLPPVVDLNTLLRLYIQRPDPNAMKTPSVEVIRGLKKEITPLPQ